MRIQRKMLPDGIGFTTPHVFKKIFPTHNYLPADIRRHAGSLVGQTLDV
ncbi:protein of unknown function (plasmid) [Pararobbsia alpina]